MDSVTTEVVTALDGGGIPSILLKGPSIARWLYPSGGRAYRDSDLLVESRCLARAVSVLRGLGFVEQLSGFAASELPEDSMETTFVRRREARGGLPGVIDLHVSLTYLSVDDRLLWEAFASETETLLLADAQVRVLNRGGVLFHIVLHAVQHGFAGHTAEDLRRAVESASPDEWKAAAALAERLEALDLFSSGLRRGRRGTALAERLGLPTPAQDPPWWHEPPGATSVARFRSAPTLRDKFLLARCLLVPSRSKIVYLYDLRRPNRRALARAYLRRWWFVAASLLPAARWTTSRDHDDRR